ncbi:tetratricopeptide (TPR) repeat protein [Duganella sp. 1224]|uniref:tetratricopeptide repeat protein n=1 Tax=Duganella sp. 1224 TaxID=2587052 RepID=UPI0015C7AD6B|nr:tetratricopeptide repeat protein [Duganella sp. 1224]NYE61645.1 tetratricopeptide (TPR) repeat protein [Duganella sp. 1224]
MTTVIDSREIRIFLSSTFRDMEAERSYLLQQVFPRFRQDCASRNVGFTEIDLRWGITEQAAQNGQTVEICLSEIDRCRDYPPFFIGFLGARYGWVPDSTDLDAYWTGHHDPLYAEAIRAALGQGISVTELEMRFGVLDHLDAPQAANAHFYLRDAGLSDRLAQGCAPADFFDAGHGKLDALKRALRASGKVDLDGYTSIEAFGERVYQRLLEGLDQRYPAEQVPDERQQRAQDHARFAVSRGRNYVPLPAMRLAVLDALNHASAGGAPRPLYLSGPSGIGKSALMADLAVWLPQQLRGADIYARYSGADGSRDLAQWRDDLLVHLGAAVLPKGDTERWQALGDALAQRAAAGPIVLLLDAIDQLDDAPRALATLAQQYWPAPVRLVVSGLTAIQPAQGYTVLTVPAPDSALRADIIGAFTSGYRKALAPALVARLAAAVPSASPLFLRMVLEELRVRSHHETLGADMDTLLAQQQPDALFAHLLRGWDADYSDARHPAIVSTLAGLLALSRGGLSETELADLLAAPDDPISPESGKPRLPSARLSPLLGVLRPYLLRNAGQETLMHQALQRGAQPAAPAALRQALIRQFPAWHWRHVTERLFQQLQLTRAAAQGGAEWTALEQQLRSLSTFIYLPRDQRVLMRDSLYLMDAASAADDTPAARIGQAWGAQLRSIPQLSLAQKALGWLRSKQGTVQESTRLGWLNELVGELNEWAYLQVSLPLAEAALAVLEQRGDEPAKLAAAYSNLALLNMELGRMEQANSVYARLDRLAQQVPEAVRADQSLYILNQAGLYLRQGMYQQALPLALEAVEQLRRAVPYSAAQLAAALETLGTIRHNLGDAEAASAVLEEALAASEQGRPANHPSRMLVMANLAQSYAYTNRFDEAEALFRRALSASEEHLTAGHPMTGIIMTQLGGLYHQLNRLEQAEALLLRALALHRAAYGDMHPEIAKDLTYLGNVYQVQGRYAEVEAALEEVLAFWRAQPSTDVLALLRSLLVMAKCKQGLRKYAEAEQLCQEAIALSQARVAPIHPEYATASSYLAELYGETRRLDEAERLLLDVLAQRRQTLPAGHSYLASTLHQLGELYLLRQQAETAEPLLLEALQITQTLSATPQVESGRILLNLGNLYLMQQRYADAESAQAQAAAIFTAAIGASPGHLGDAVVLLAMVRMMVDHWAEAVALAQQALAIYQPLGSGFEQQQFNCLHILSIAPQPPEQALAWQEQALALGRTLLPDILPRLSVVLDHAAGAAAQLKSTGQAEALRQEQVGLWRDAAQSGDAVCLQQLAYALAGLGQLRHQSGQSPRAVAPLEEALALYRAHGANPQVLIITLSALVDVYCATQHKIGTAMALRQEIGALAARLHPAA